MFVWDEKKRLKVLDEHRVDLALITDIFDDPNAVYRDDHGHSESETRYTVTGITAQYGLVFLVFTYSDEMLRLITARRAEKWMVKDYERRL
ncbi:MAG: BrnT family toxin [Pyrinomonadaceae bacterium]